MILQHAASPDRSDAAALVATSWRPPCRRESQNAAPDVLDALWCAVISTHRSRDSGGRLPYPALRGLMKAGAAFIRFASRFSLRVSFAAFFTFPPRGALPAMSFTLPFFSWRDSDDHSPFADAKHFRRKWAPTCLFWAAGYGEGHVDGRPS
jgi:hypothetical protein